MELEDKKKYGNCFKLRRPTLRFICPGYLPISYTLTSCWFSPRDAVSHGDAVKVFQTLELPVSRFLLFRIHHKTTPRTKTAALSHTLHGNNHPNLKYEALLQIITAAKMLLHFLGCSGVRRSSLRCAWPVAATFLRLVWKAAGANYL